MHSIPSDAALAEAWAKKSELDHKTCVNKKPVGFLLKSSNRDFNILCGFPVQAKPFSSVKRSEHNHAGVRGFGLKSSLL